MTKRERTLARITGLLQGMDEQQLQMVLDFINLPRADQQAALDAVRKEGKA